VCQELTALIDKMEQTANIDLMYHIKDRMVDRLAATRILQRPAGAFAPAFDLEMGVLLLLDTFVHGLDALGEQSFERGKVVLDWLEQNQ
jgi:hypothetical protein